MKLQITLNNKERKIDKSDNDYYAYTTNDGDLSCFEKDVYNKLNEHMGELLDLDILERGKRKDGKPYRNIVGFNGSAVETDQTPVGSPAPIPTPIVAQAVEEHAFRIKLSTTSKGVASWECTIRAHSAQEARERLASTCIIAMEKCQELNAEAEVKE